MIARYTRLYVDPAGESHFEDVDTELTLIDFAAAAPPLYLSALAPAAQFAFFGAPGGWRADWHPSASRNLFVVISGEWEITASDIESRRFGSGSILLVEDITGRGHASRVCSDEDSLAVLVQLPDA